MKLGAGRWTRIVTEANSGLGYDILTRVSIVKLRSGFMSRLKIMSTVVKF